MVKRTILLVFLEMPQKRPTVICEMKQNENLQFAKWKHSNDLLNRNCKLQIYL